MGACSSKTQSSKSPNKYKEPSSEALDHENTASKAHNVPKPESLENLEPLDRQLFHLQCNITVACQNSQDQWLLVKDPQTNTWRFVTGQAHPPEDFFKAGINRFKEQIGADVLLIGVLKMEYSINPEHNFQRMKAIFYAKLAPQGLKKVHNKKKKEEVKKMSSQEIMKEYAEGGNIDKEVYNWVKYVEDKGVIYPLTIVAKEGARVVKSEQSL